MAKSSRVKRRAMARSRAVRRGGFSGFYAAIVVICIVGFALVLVSRKSNSAGAVGPYLSTDKTPHNKADEHWHAAIAVNICGTWQPGPIWPSYTSGATPTLARKGTNVYAGLHTHTLPATGQSDGLIHMEPAVTEEAGKNATVGKWLEYGGWHMSSSSLDLWPGSNGKPIKVKNGDVCKSGPYKGQKGVVRWARGQHQSGKTTKLVEQHSNITHYKLYDQDVIGVYFLPRSVKLTGDLQQVPSEVNLANASAGEGAGHTNVTTTTTPAPGATTTAPAGATTTAPAGATTTAPAGATTTAPAGAATTTPTTKAP